MDLDFWLKFYRNWEMDELIAELGTCHTYQRTLLQTGCLSASPYESLYNLLVQSQTREDIINQAIREKIKNGS